MVTRNLGLGARGPRTVRAGITHGSNHGYSQKLKIVCHPCNNGWMSQLQIRAKPWLLPLVLGQWSDLSVEAQAALAAWATMFTIIAEYVDPPMAGVSLAERREFMASKEALPGWKIWVGTYARGDRRIHNHFGFHIRLPGDLEAAEKPNTQTSGFCVGRVFFQVFSTTSRLVEDDVNFALRYGVRTIWPTRGVVAPPPVHHDFAGFMALSNDFVTRRGGVALPEVPKDILDDPTRR